MIKHTKLLVGVLILILGACVPVQPAISEPPSTLPPTLLTLEGSPTSTLTPVEARTDTPSPTVEIAPSETQVQVVILTLPPLTLVTVRPTKKTSRTKVPTDTPTATTERPPSETPSPTPTLTPSPTPTLACERVTASVALSVSSENVKVGDTIKVTVTVNNEGCAILGLPQYRLNIQSDGTQSIFTPENPDPVEHYLGVGLGQSDAAEFELIAAAGGQATLTATVSYEVHLGYPGPAYWGMTGTGEPLSITVAP